MHVEEQHLNWIQSFGQSEREKNWWWINFSFCHFWFRLRLLLLMMMLANQNSMTRVSEFEFWKAKESAYDKSTFIFISSCNYCLYDFVSEPRQLHKKTIAAFDDYDDNNNDNEWAALTTIDKNKRTAKNWSLSISVCGFLFDRYVNECVCVLYRSTCLHFL